MGETTVVASDLGIAAAHVRTTEAAARIAAHEGAARAVERDPAAVIGAAGPELLDPQLVSRTVVTREPGVEVARTRSTEASARPAGHVEADRSIGRDSVGLIFPDSPELSDPSLVPRAVVTREPGVEC